MELPVSKAPKRLKDPSERSRGPCRGSRPFPPASCYQTSAFLIKSRRNYNILVRSLIVGITVTDTVQRSTKNASWTLSQQAFGRFLEWLDDGAGTQGQSYLEMRRRLVTYFDRKNCLEPDELADETLNRVARRLEEEGSIRSDTPAKFCYTVARYVFLESLRSNRSKEVSIDEDARPLVDNAGSATDEADEKERMFQCLEKCCQKLEPESRDLITRYYHGKEREKIENRRRMAEMLGISMNALSIRACRIRDRLEICVRKCASEGQ